MTPRTPTTAAGRALLREILPGKPPFLSEIVPLRSIIAIEAEARATLDVARLRGAFIRAGIMWAITPPELFEESVRVVAREYAALEEPTP